jgi:hypothetical protein
LAAERVTLYELLPACPATAPARSGTTSGLLQAISTGAQSAPYLSGWTLSLLVPGGSSVRPTGLNTRPVAALTSANASLISRSPFGGASASLTT